MLLVRTLLGEKVVQKHRIETLKYALVKDCIFMRIHLN